MKERMKKNQSTFFITVQQFFEDLLEDSAFEWLENCKNKTFFFKGKKMSSSVQLPKVDPQF